MPEIRKDPILGHYIIVASGRQNRPNDFADQKHKTANLCPFCAGNEHLTPPEIFRIDADQKTDVKSGEWKLRVVPNKFPAVYGDMPLSPQKNSLYSVYNAPGRHEVIIETPDHDGKLETMPLEHTAGIIKTMASRAKEILAIPFIKYAMIFKNQGRSAGASLAHPHSQIAGIPIAPKRITDEISSCRRYFKEHKECLFCKLVKEEQYYSKRIIAQNALFTAFAPFAGRIPFEINIFPLEHLPRFEEITDEEASMLAEILQSCLKKLSCSITGLAYNMMILTSPKDDDFYHWHIEIMPKLSQAAGFEQGTGFFINTVAPEQAAEILNSGKKFTL